MERRLIDKREKLLERISEREYRSVLKFVSDIYLEDFQLKVLMARKFSNLFLALLDLSREEDGGCISHEYKEKYLGREEPYIISNHALEFFKKKIQSREITSILLADDIVVHGRTISDIYKTLVKWYEEAGITKNEYQIKVMAYAGNRDGYADEFKDIDICTIQKQCNTAQWRKISNKIVETFYVMGQPYTSYVPNCKIGKQETLGEKIGLFLKENSSRVQRLKDDNIQGSGFVSYIYNEEQNAKFASMLSLRIYQYSSFGEFVFVPMVTLNPIEESVMQEYYEVFSDIVDAQFKLLLEQTSKEVKYRCVIYLISALYGWKFVKEKLYENVKKLTYDKREEEHNFSHIIIDNMTHKIDVDNLWNKLNEIYLKQEDIQDTLEDGFKDSKRIEAMINVFDKNLSGCEEASFNKKTEWVSGIINNLDLPKRILSKYLFSNGKMDEGQPKERYLGIPLYLLIRKLREKCKIGDSIIAAIINAIDVGKGSIVAKRYDSNDRVYFLSFIHAGEQNYKYFENYYFPFLIGLYSLEFKTKESGKGKYLNKMKEKFINTTISYWEKEGLYYIQEDIEQIRATKSIEHEYGDALKDSLYMYSTDSLVNRAIMEANEILDSYKNI